MSIRFACRCGKKMKAPDDKIGKKVLCPDCGSPVLVPDSNTAVVPTVAAGAADTATDLLRGSAEEGRKKPRSHFAFEDEGGNEVIGYDALETIKSFALTVVPALALTAFLVFSVYWLSSMVVKSGPKRPPLGEVTGTVTLDGKPVVGAVIAFYPESGKDSGSEVAASTARTDKTGKYTLLYVRDVEGAALGQHDVVIRARRQGVPTKYSRREEKELSAVVEEGDNEIDFDLTSEQTLE